ncbi:MAG TPA: alanine--tRNA ligase-related protein, partial [Candidatus Binatia bacterium]|nr:alanine--tRNA ligase-related protein [Candidatus Binatia bacterium]
ALDIGIENELCQRLVPVITELYAADFPEVQNQKEHVTEAFAREEKLFRQTLRSGLRELDKVLAPSEPGAEQSRALTGEILFRLYDTHGFPVELSKEEAKKKNIEIAQDANTDFERLMDAQRKRSQTASAGMFKGGLADHSQQVIKYHTTTHLMYQALKNVLGDGVVQRGSNITAERTRFDFSHPEKVTREQLDEVEKIVNEKIAQDLPVTWKEEDTKEAFAKGASGAFGDKYGDKVKVYTIGDPEHPFSREICGGPHVEHTGVIGEGGKKFKITKEEASSAGIRRIKAVLE